jgi:hypothetical protein
VVRDPEGNLRFAALDDTNRADSTAALTWIQIGSMAGELAAVPSVALRAARLQIIGSGIDSITPARAATPFTAREPSPKYRTRPLTAAQAHGRSMVDTRKPQMDGLPSHLLAMGSTLSAAPRSCGRTCPSSTELGPRTC